jgi:Cys-tRNA(Pro) deacylase
VGKKKTPSTAALRQLKQSGVAFELRLYTYVERGGTRASSEALGVPEHQVIKTLVFEDDRHKPLVVLMHGDRQVSAKALARRLGLRSVSPCSPEVAQRHSGYKVGGTSPFGMRKALPVYVEASILELDTLLINGGGRGLLVELSPSVLTELLQATPVSVARSTTGS